MAIQVLALSVFMLIWSLRITSVSSTNCETVFPNSPTFQDCHYRCHCKTDVQCDNITGYCNDGCDFGWMGPGCQYRNIAKDKHRARNEGGTDISTDYATRAVDGDVSTCARTNGSSPNYHYWRIEWTRDYRIVGLVVKIKSANANDFTKFRVETGTGPNNGDFNSVCYQHSDTPGTSVMEIMCKQPAWTRHLRIILDKPNTRLRVCEVEIYGGRDVTFNKPTNQTSTYESSFSSLSVDSQPHVSPLRAEKTCSTTAVGQNNPYWLVNFLADYVVQSVFFYGRLSHYEQYSGFQLSVLNTGASETLLYTDPGNIDVNQYQPRVIDVNISRLVTSRYLKVLRPLDNTLLTVCEIVTFAECPPNKCGWDCTTACHCDAETTGTYQKDGDCPNGCSGRWTGVDKTCDIECNATAWGNQCQNNCGHCRQADSCDVVTGHCEHGCSGPWYTPECTQECSNKSYGINCSQTCGYCKNDLQCNITNGHCGEGCITGWQPPLCQAVCTSGKYGDGCSNDCGSCLGEEPCNHITGVCANGCDPGYQPTLFCNTMCDFGKYGLNCSGVCGHCKDGRTCNATTGVCGDGCQPGWETSYCNKTCEAGKFGDKCANDCGNCSGDDICNRTTGYCPNACAAGFKGNLCKTACDVGKYGPNCVNKCGNCNSTADCSKETGECSSGCLPGWINIMCKTPCETGKFGDKCADDCGNCYEVDICKHTTGSCPNGCAAGFKGDLCKAVCDNSTYGRNCVDKCGQCANSSQCNITNGVCPGDCEDSYTGPLCREKVGAAVGQPNGPSPPTGTIIGALAGVLVVVGIACAVTILFLRRRNMHSKSRKPETENCSTFTNSAAIQDNKEEPKVVVNNANNVYYNHGPKRNDIEVSTLRQMCVSAKQNPEALYKEFQEIPYGLKFDASEARDMKYKPKNRYKEMFPYNETRVHLPEIPGDELSTYINASYINGYDIPNKYIAAQGAMETTISDVWRMVWSKNASIVVMLTNCVELGKLKCAEYWPGEETEVYGDISVENVRLESYSDFIIRTFECTKICSGEKRQVLQFHYTAWPDKDVPDTALSLVQFWRTVRYNQASNAFPWIIHCSAGVGRTGTFIALDFLYEMGTAERIVNIKETVKTLRQQRLNMVQTKEQYVYVHETVAEVLNPIGSVCRNEDFPEIYQYLFHDNDKPKQKLFKEFEDVNKYKVEVEDEANNEDVYCNVFRSQSADAKLEENLGKSRDMEIIPADIHRPRLSMVVMGRNDFINAVYLPTFRNRDRLILTQVPLENTVEDFLRMVWEYNITTVVLLEESLPEECSYLPTTTTSKQVGVFTTELRNERVEDCYVLRTIGLSLDGRMEQKEFHQFHFKSWPQYNPTPIDTGSVLRLISNIENNNNSRGHSPIVVQCLNGATKSGVFSTLWCLLEKAKSDNEIAVAETVRLSRMRRKQIIENIEQYTYCYKVMRDYLDSFNVYANAI